MRRSVDPAQRREPGPRHSSMIEVIEVLVAVVLMTTPWLWPALRFGSDFILLPDGSPACRAADTGRDHFLTWAPAQRAALVARGHAVGEDDSAAADLDDTLGQQSLKHLVDPRSPASDEGGQLLLGERDDRPGLVGAVDLGTCGFASARVPFGRASIWAGCPHWVAVVRLE